MLNYLSLLGELNTLGPIDIVFFVICAVIIAAIVGVYFLIPVLNKKQYQEQRENLKKREEAFKVNQKKKDEQNVEAESVATEEVSEKDE